MRRLVQGRETIDPAERRLVALVRATEKTSVNPFRKRAILHRLERGGRRTPLLRSWASGVAGVLLVGTATAGTVSWWRDRQPEQPAPVVSTPVSSASPVTPPISLKPVQRSAEIEPAPEPVPPPVRVPASRANATGQARAKSAGEDPTLVMQAIRALRSEHDPVRAEELLQSYLRANPRGALAEEALALQIEAARARQDVVAVERAARYLRLYPQGVYRKAAENALRADR